MKEFEDDAEVHQVDEEHEFDMEDLVAPVRKKRKTSPIGSTLLHHHAATHDLRASQVKDVCSSLLRWYDAHRRRLPWRGDAPPFVSTASHTKTRTRHASSSSLKSGTLLAFFKREAEDNGQQPPSGTGCSGGDEASDRAVALKEEPVKAEADMNVQDTVLLRTVSPYETWVSEIMLQQTRVDTVVDYFLRWTDKFPTVAALASGSDEVGERERERDGRLCGFD